jgi:predicted lipoprotein with Yx(FWY)xxD motif
MGRRQGQRHRRIRHGQHRARIEHPRARPEQRRRLGLQLLKKSFTLKVAKNVHSTDRKFAQFAVKKVDVHENVAVGPNGFAVYTFQGETTHHLICKKSSNPANNCWSFWPPVTVNSASGLSRQAGIKGKLGTFRDHGKLQLTLNGKPLWYFTPDIQSHNRRVATSDETRTFGSIWHIVKAAGPAE